MNNGEFEKIYREARAVLHRRGKAVGSPTTGHDGLRYCRIDGTPLTDCEVLKEAWGENLADEILRERPDQRALRHAG